MKSAAGFDQCGAEFEDAKGVKHKCNLSAEHKGKHWCAEHNVVGSPEVYPFDSDAVEQVDDD